MKKLSTLLILIPLIFAFLACDNWMKSDGFFEEIDQEVFVANAEKINVYVRYAVTTQGTTAPSGSVVFKVDVQSDISCITNTSYGFHHWAAFSNEFFDIQKQHKNIFYESGAGGYDEVFLENELPEDVITFGDKFSPTTTVKIHSSRNDIVLVPIVAERPKIDRTSPTLNQAGVVRNTSIRYLFSKKMDLQTFNSENVKITSGYSVMTDQEIVSDDITSKFIWNDETAGICSPVRSETGKMVTFRLKSGETLGSNQQITINFSNILRDADGYEMETDDKLFFTTGTSIDSLAPIIQELKCGVDDKFLTFDSVEKNGEVIFENGNLKPLANEVFDPYFAHRVADKINIYLYATDIGGEGVNASTANVDEEAVSFYGIRAKLLYNANGETAEDEIKAAQYAYVPSGNDIEGNTTDDMNRRGYAFSYDLSSLPDGLIAIDVWAMDIVGNAGINEPYYDTYDNGYRTLLVVKDTSAPNVATEKTKVISKSDQAVYGWYNKETLNNTFVQLGDKQIIIDSGNEKLRSASDKIKWIFAVGDKPESWKPEASDPSWRLISEGRYSLGSINTQKEGSVEILMALMDDIGNISETVVLEDTVKSDLTIPSVSAVSWVDASGNAA